MEGMLKPLKAKDWDRALLASYRSFSLQSAPLDLGAVRPPVLIIQVGWLGLLVIGLCYVVFDCCSCSLLGLGEVRLPVLIIQVCSTAHRWARKGRTSCVLSRGVCER